MRRGLATWGGAGVLALLGGVSVSTVAAVALPGFYWTFLYAFPFVAAVAGPLLGLVHRPAGWALVGTCLAFLAGNLTSWLVQVAGWLPPLALESWLYLVLLTLWWASVAAWVLALRARAARRVRSTAVVAAD